MRSPHSALCARTRRRLRLKGTARIVGKGDSSMKTVRIAFTKTTTGFTPRGKSVDYYSRGFIRRHGRTIVGTAYDCGPEMIFYPNLSGVNYQAAYDYRPMALRQE